MKKILFILTLFAIAFFLNNCGNSKKTIICKPINVYKIENVNDDFFQWDGLIENTEFIKLETTNSSVLGQITKGIVDRNEIYLLDFKNQTLLNFDNNGKFIRKLGQRGKGPEEFLEVRDFCVADNIIYTLDYKKIHCYNINTGDYVDSWSFNSENGFNPENFVVYNKNEYFLWNSNPDVWDKNKGEYYRLRKIKKGKIDSEYFKFEYKISGDPRFYVCGDDSYYLKPIDGESVIYKLSKDSIFASFEIDFGNKAISSKDIEDLRNSGVPNAYLKSNFFKNISNVLEIKDYLYFKCIGPESKVYEALIRKKTGEIKFGRWNYKRSPRFFYSDGTTLYGYYEPYNLIDNLDSSDLNTCFNSVRNNIKNVKISDNLIIVKVHFKK